MNPAGETILLGISVADATDKKLTVHAFTGCIGYCYAAANHDGRSARGQNVAGQCLCARASGDAASGGLTGVTAAQGRVAVQAPLSLTRLCRGYRANGC